MAEPDHEFWSIVMYGAPKNLYINTQVCRRQSLGITQKWLPIVGHKSGYFLVDISGNKHNLNALLSITQKMFETGRQSRGLVFQ